MLKQGIVDVDTVLYPDESGFQMSHEIQNQLFIGKQIQTVLLLNLL